MQETEKEQDMVRHKFAAQAFRSPHRCARVHKPYGACWLGGCTSERGRAAFHKTLRSRPSGGKEFRLA